MVSLSGFSQQFSHAPATVPTPTRGDQQRAVRPALAPANTNGSVWLIWDAGKPPQQLSNLTTRTTLSVSSHSNATMKGMMPGTTNVFVAFNADGASNLATGIAAIAFGPKLSIQPVPIHIVSWTANTNWGGKTNVLMEQVDSITGSYAAVFRIVPTNGQVVAIWRTNAGTSRFYRLMLE